MGILLLGSSAPSSLGTASMQRRKKKQCRGDTGKKEVAVYPHELMLEIVMIAAIGGLAGAKLFNALETWDDFIRNPIRSLTSSSGLTFLGGLIVATISFYYYTRRHKIPFKHMCDAAAPGIMLAYGLGRLGCQFSGDGDWGIYNTAYVSDPDGALRAATPADASHTMAMWWAIRLLRLFSGSFRACHGGCLA